MRDLDSTPGGLADEAAAARLRTHGRNVLVAGTRQTALRLFTRQITSPLVLILVFAALVSTILRDWVEAAIIVVIVVASATLGFVQEWRASTAIERLQRRLALVVRVVRGGIERMVAAETLVPGDIVRLSAGNLIPADGLLLEARDFLVTEASLTGESFPVEKQPGIVAADAGLPARTNAVFLGTSVRSGTASFLVVRTGHDTVYGEIAHDISGTVAESEFTRGVRQFGYLLVRVMVLLVIFVLVVNQLLARPLLESLLYALALAVGMSPELLPAIVSVTLAHGARAMARSGVLVRHLDAIENLGSIDVLCTDKTGTLTAGTMVLHAATDPRGEIASDVLVLAYLNASFETGIENPLDAAIVAAGRAGASATAGWTKIDEIPYDFMRKRLTIVVASEGAQGRHRIVTKGAFREVVAVCTHLDEAGDIVALDAERRIALEAHFMKVSTEGYRVLGVAVKDSPAKSRYAREDETGMTFVGFLLFVDPPKEGVEKTIRDLASLGIRIKIVSGDNRYVTAHLAKRIGLDSRSMLTGAEISAMSNDSLWSHAERTDFFVEVDPQQKERIVRALQHRGHAVGYLGDGINDAPALHAADVGISVEGAVDVARESADIVLLESGLEVLRRGVEDGRRTFANTLKYICITTSANFGNMISMALATPFLPFLPMLAKQILLNNFLSDIPSIALATDRVDAAAIDRAQRWNLRELARFMVVFGLVSTVFDLFSFVVLLHVYEADEVTFQTAWFVVSLLTELAVVIVLRTRLPAWRSVPAPLLAWATVACIVVAVALPYTKGVAGAFGFVALPLALTGTLVAIVVAYIAVTEAAKLWFYRTRRAAGAVRRR